MRFAERVHPDTEIVSQRSPTETHRYTYADAFRRVRQLANALQAAGVKPGDRIGTLAWKEPDAQVESTELLAWLEGRVAKWWISEQVVFVAELPHTATGKVSKKDLREQVSALDKARRRTPR